MYPRTSVSKILMMSIWEEKKHWRCQNNIFAKELDRSAAHYNRHILQIEIPRLCMEYISHFLSRK
jgi:hypothetical protein